MQIRPSKADAVAVIIFKKDGKENYTLIVFQISAIVSPVGRNPPLSVFSLCSNLYHIVGILDVLVFTI